MTEATEPKRPPADLDSTPDSDDTGSTQARQAKPKGNPLIGQQHAGRFAAQRERFCHAYTGLSFGGKGKGNATQSAILSGYSESTAGSQASRLLKDAAIRARVNELTLKLAEKVLSETPEQELDDPQFPFAVLHNVAKDGRNETARVRAAELLGKQKHGYWQERVIVDIHSAADSVYREAAERLLTPDQAAAIGALLANSLGSSGKVIDVEPERAVNPVEPKE